MHFDLSQIAIEERVAALHEVARRSSVPFDAEALDPARRVLFVHDTATLARVEVTETNLSNWRGMRRMTRAGGLSEPRLVVTMGKEDGRLRLEQNTRQVTGVGSFLLPMWSITPWTLIAETPQVVRAVSVPLDLLGFPHLLTRDVVGRDVGGTPLANLFAHHVDAIIRTPLNTPAETGVAAHVLVDLLRSVLSTAVGDETGGRTSLRRTLGARIMLYLHANLRDPALTPESVAAAFGISRRYLYLILNQLGLSFADVVRRDRLHSAAEALTQPVNEHVSIGAIGAAVGFADQSSFTRAFKHEFGCTPTEWRVGRPTE